MAEEAKQRFNLCCETIEEIIAGSREPDVHHEISADLGYLIGVLRGNEKTFVKILEIRVREQKMQAFVDHLNKKGKDLFSAWEAASFVLFNRSIWQTLSSAQKAVVLLYAIMIKDFEPVAFQVFQDQELYFQKLGLVHGVYEMLQQNMKRGGLMVNGLKQQVFAVRNDNGTERIELTEAGVKLAEFLITSLPNQILDLN